MFSQYLLFYAKKLLICQFCSLGSRSGIWIQSPTKFRTSTYPSGPATMPPRDGSRSRFKYSTQYRIIICITILGTLTSSGQDSPLKHLPENHFRHGGDRLLIPFCTTLYSVLKIYIMLPGWPILWRIRCVSGSGSCFDLFFPIDFSKKLKFL
jgi:hypothetical protein